MESQFGIARYVSWYQDGKQVYGIRGTGEDAKTFYLWLNSGKHIVYNLDDFPWHYITLTNAAENQMYLVFEKHIYNVPSHHSDDFDKDGNRV